MSDQRPRSEFTDVDHAQNPTDYLHMLDAQRAIPFIQQYKQRVRGLLDLHPGLQVLDAGTGTGEDAQEMAKLVAPDGQIVGLDFSQIMIDEAKRRVQDASLPLRFVQGDIQHLPFEDATFD
jgi:ubiquinone/menaquinone biosynthesis C-methylase UbiE